MRDLDFETFKCLFGDDNSWFLEGAGQGWKKEGCQEYFMRKNAKLCFVRYSKMISEGGLLIIAKYLKAGCQKEGILLGLSTVVSLEWIKPRRLNKSGNRDTW